MARNKDGSKPSEKISDEIYSTPLVTSIPKVDMARRQRKPKKAVNLKIFSELLKNKSRVPICTSWTG